MSASAVAIANLLYTYAERIDAGDFEGAAALFRHAGIKAGNQDQLLDEAGILACWKRLVRVYPCGTPRTRHMISNPIMEIDDDAGTAAVRSCYMVFQAVDGFGLQPIASGRYHDRFERVEGVWRFSYRDYTLLDMAGDLSRHLTAALAS